MRSPLSQIVLIMPTRLLDITSVTYSQNVTCALFEFLSHCVLLAAFAFGLFKDNGRRKCSHSLSLLVTLTVLCVCSFNGASHTEEEGKEKGERRHSHTVLSMSDSLTLPLLSSPTSLPRTSKTSMGVYLHLYTQ